MPKELTLEQQLDIEELLSSDEGHDAEVTLGQLIREKLRLSENEWVELEDAIETYCVRYFEDCAGTHGLAAFDRQRADFGGPILAPPELAVKPNDSEGGSSCTG